MIPHHVPLLGVSATLTKAKCLRVFDKAGFCEDYQLMQTSLDRPEIQQIHRFMKHAKSNLLDLQFILPPKAMHAKNIQKTIIFVNTVAEVLPLVEAIRGWMRQLKYPQGSGEWVRPYFSTMPDLDKTINAEAFKLSGETNTKCTILVATNAYGMGIDSPDIKLVIQWDLPMSFDSMIQRMSRAGRQAGLQTVFILMTPKWTQVKDEKEIQDRIAARTDAANTSSLLSDLNRPKTKGLKASPLSCETNAEDSSDAESLASSDVDKDFDDSETNQLFALFATEAEEESLAKKAKKRTSATDAEKRAKLPDDIFSYIHIAKCRQLFSLDWYDDTTYAPNNDGSIKPLPVPCCNGSGCKSLDPEYLNQVPFIDTTTIKFKESEREWIAIRTARLRKWRTAKSKVFWADQEVENMPDSLLMPDACLLALAKHGDLLFDEAQVDQFL